MSWLATKYAWKCSNPDVKGGTRLVFLALAMRVTYRRITTRPTSLSHFAKLTLMSAEQIRRCLNTLERVGEIRRIRRGSRATYAFPKMAGPLFSVTWEEEPVKMTEFSFPKALAEKPVKMTGSGRQMPGFSARLAGGVPSSLNVLSTNSVPATTTENTAVEAFLDWFLTEYPKHRRGVLYRGGDPRKLEGAVRELLAVRSLARVQAMALAMWADTVDPWLNDPNPAKTNDRGVFSLLHKSTYLEALVIAQEPAPPPTVWDDVLARVAVKISRHAFYSWFLPLKLADDRGDVIVIAAPDDAHVRWVQKHLAAALEEAMSEVRPGTAVAFVTQQQAAFA